MINKLKDWFQNRVMGADWFKLIVPMVIILIIVMGILVWLALPKPDYFPPTEGYFEKIIADAQQKNASHFAWLYKTNIIIQCVLILTALLAAIFASLTTKDNAEDVKKWSVLLTAVTAALASVLSTFHIRENIESLIKVTLQLNQLEADYLAARASFVDESKDAEKSDTQKKLRDLNRTYTTRFNIILDTRMHAYANVGQQSLQSVSLTDPSSLNPANPSSPSAPAPRLMLLAERAQLEWSPLPILTHRTEVAVIGGDFYKGPQLLFLTLL
jgi:hypothetical protein